MVVQAASDRDARFLLDGGVWVEWQHITMWRPKNMSFERVGL